MLLFIGYYFVRNLPFFDSDYKRCFLVDCNYYWFVHSKKDQLQKTKKTKKF